MEQKGSKMGWTFGGLGGLLWMLLLAGVMLAKGNSVAAIDAFCFFIVGILYIILFPPWKYPHVPFRRIYVGLLVIIIVAAVVMLYFWYPGEFDSMSNLRTLFMLFPLFLPIFIFGKKTWSDIHRK